MSALALVAVVAAAVWAYELTRTAEPTPPAPGVVPPDLILLVVTSDAGPSIAVVGSDGARTAGAVSIPAGLPITIPGQGDGLVGDAATQPGSAGATAISNLLGAGVDHYAVLTLDQLVGVVDRAGGIENGGRTQTGEDVRSALSATGDARKLAWKDTLSGLLGSGVHWSPSDYTTTDDAAAVNAVLDDAGRVAVEDLPTRVSAGNLVEPDYDAIASMMRSIFGTRAVRIVPVTVLNGSGAPGVGELVAERIVPAGFRIVVSGNATSFDHDTTLIVVSSKADRPDAQRVADLLGVGEVAVSGPASGLAEVTVVVGKDFSTE